MAAKRMEESARTDASVHQEEDGWRLSDQERRILLSIDYLVFAIVQYERDKLNIQQRRNITNARAELVHAFREYGSWLVSEDGRASMALWNDSVREEEEGTSESCL